MRSARLIVHRIQRPLEDSTFVFAEAYDPLSFAPDGNAKLCLVGGNGCSGEPARPPYVGAPATAMLKLCELTGVSDASKRYEVELRSGERLMAAATATQPPAMGLKAKLERHGDGLWVTGTTDLEIHRILIWIARIVDRETKDIRWSSEAEPELVTVDHRQFRAAVPKERLADCKNCGIGLQVVSEQTIGALTVLSEGAWVIYPEEMP